MKTKSDCSSCGKSFIKKCWHSRFCSPECSHEFQRRDAKEKRAKNRKIPLVRSCLFCEEEFAPYSHVQKFCCDMCRRDYLVWESNEKWANKPEPTPRKRVDSNAVAYKFFAIKNWYPKNNVFRG